MYGTKEFKKSAKSARFDFNNFYSRVYGILYVCMDQILVCVCVCVLLFFCQPQLPDASLA
jgi:hypothetical protein